jgi:hypothetical protein
LSSRADSDFGAEDAEFVRLVAPLEIAAGKVLEGDGRAACLRAFEECPRGFALAAASALEGRKPIGLLVWMVQHRHPEKLEVAAARAEEPKRSKGACFVCGIEGLLAEYAGKLWCDPHLEEERAFNEEIAL